MGNRLISVICAVAALAGMVLLIIGYRNYSSKQTETSAVYAEMAEKLGALEREKNDAEKAVKEIDDEMEAAADRHSTVSIVFRGASEKIYSEIYPVMKNRGIKGTISISANALPDGEGLLRAQQIGELLEDEWILIAEWTDADGMSAVKTWAESAGYSLNETVLVSGDAYTDDVKSAIADLGYTTVITNNSADGEDSVYTDTVGDVWDPDAMGYLDASRNVVVAKAMEKKGHVIFTVGFENTVELYASDKFGAMISYLSSYKDELKVMNTVSAKAYRTEADARYAAAVSAVQEERDTYLGKIAEIEDKIAAVYKEYDTAGTK